MTFVAYPPEGLPADDVGSQNSISMFVMPDRRVDQNDPAYVVRSEPVAASAMALLPEPVANLPDDAV